MKITQDTVALAFDSHSLDKLKREAARHPRQQAMAVARQLEGVFLQMMLKSMRQTLPGDTLSGSSPSRLFTSLYDEQIARQNGERGLGLGLAKLIAQQMRPAVAPDEQAGTRPMPLGPLRVPVQPPAAVLRDTLRQVIPALPQPTAAMTSFLNRIRQPAQQISARSGIPHQLILAQAALESGWGQRQILRRDGQPSFNLFGIKAGAHWQGETTAVMTTEYHQGIPEKRRDSFRVYHSYREALEDYARLITENPRYRAVTGAVTAESAAHALQKAGYASDPAYAKKLITVIRQLQTMSVQAISTDLSNLF